MSGALVDLRSDTVTRPSPAMREAMARAEVGDDVYGEDPTVNRLQERVAELLGVEAALYVPSGSMGNQIALKVHTRPGDDVIIGEGAHNFLYESGAAGAIAGAATRTALSGGSFGDNLLAVIPDVIGSTIGNALGSAISGGRAHTALSSPYWPSQAASPACSPER
ncbi:MAG: hypothetical protein H7X93_09075 [Sphingomonadaceae bacterium]|nr:hypothetical protein [Sphingomonadaceae bacterium]